MVRKHATSRPSGAAPSKTAGSGDATPTRYVLPTDLEASLKYLDDAQLDALVSAASAEARRRRPDGGAAASAPSAAEKASGAKGRPVSLPPGQERIIRAAFEAGVKPVAIAVVIRSLGGTEIERHARDGAAPGRVVPVRLRHCGIRSGGQGAARLREIEEDALRRDQLEQHDQAVTRGRGPAIPCCFELDRRPMYRDHSFTRLVATQEAGW